MRAFFLVDPANPDDEYSLTINTHFLYSPQGLGFEEENTYRQIGGNFILANSKPKQSVFQANIHFGGSAPYSRYRDFLAYCARPNIQLAYYTGGAAMRDQQRNLFRVYGTESYDEESGASSSIYRGVLVPDDEVVGAPYKRYYANAMYDLQNRKIASCTHIVYHMEYSSGGDVEAYRTYTNSNNVAEAKVYRFSVTGIKNNSVVLSNLLPYFGNAFDSEVNYYTNQVFQYSGDSYIYYCIRIDTLADQTLGQWAASASTNGLQFYCELDGGD